jgi:electron transport complex protein RnfE
MSFLKLLRNGIIDENPTFVQLLALCPLLAVTTSGLNAIVMGLSTTAVMICACCAISLLRKLIPNDVRIAVFVVIVASFVSFLQLVLEAYAPPSLSEGLGIYIPLIVVNCILFARIESFASKNKVIPSAVDAFAMGIGFTIGLLTLGIIREFFGNGSFFGINLMRDSSSQMLIMIMAPGAFFTLGVIIMFRKYIMSKKSRSKKR